METIIVEKTFIREVSETFVKAAVATVGVMFALGATSLVFGSKKDQEETEK